MARHRELALDDAPEAYRHFDAQENGWTKVVLHPRQRVARQPRAAQEWTQQK
jgi:hypothetical protein